MKRGRPRKPTEQKKLQGTYRKDRENPDEPEYAAAAEIPPPPPYLKGRRARKVWRQIASELWTMKLLPRVSEPALARYCKAMELWCYAMEQVDNLDPVVATKSGNLVMNPYLLVANRQQEILHRLEVEFGLTPASKSRITVAPARDAGGPKGKVLTKLQRLQQPGRKGKRGSAG